MSDADQINCKITRLLPTQWHRRELALNPFPSSTRSITKEKTMPKVYCDGLDERILPECHYASLSIRWFHVIIGIALLSAWSFEELHIEIPWKKESILARSLTTSSPLNNVLTFGGSTTWGAMLENRNDAFPSLLAREAFVGRSDNLAIRASSAVWPSQCLQSMVSEQGTADLDYNVVLFEFSVNGLMGLHLLLQRIRNRYPRALLIYIDLYSNRRPGWSNCLNEKCRMNPSKQEVLEGLIGSFGGYTISLPRPKNPLKFDDILHYFANDMHHLGPEGHQWVAHEVLSLMSLHGKSTIGKQGNWFEGDVCGNWFDSGIISPHIQLQGGNMTHFSPGKYAYEIQSEARMLITTDQLREESPLIFVFMTKGNPSLYPYLQVIMDGNISTVVVNPLNIRWESSHVTFTQAVGTVSPETTHHVQLRNLEKTKDFPFRLVGVVMCAACQALDVDVTKTCHTLGCVQVVLDD